VPAAVLLRGGARLYLVPAGGGTAPFVPLGREADDAARQVASGFSHPIRDDVVRWLRSQGAPSPLAVAGAALSEALARAGVATRPATEDELRGALAVRPGGTVGEERGFRLASLRLQLDLALASDSETLIALSREEVRVERTLRREEGALDQFLAPPSGPLADQRDETQRHRDDVELHYAALVGRVEAVARRVLPNLSKLVGARVAARLYAAGGDPGALARMPAARLQVVGAHRRPGGGHGPRFGLLYEAARMEDVPEDRQGRYARTLAALAVVAARADLLTHRDVADRLIARRDRRVQDLRKGR
jgi:snoRNA binding domain, fibrillarin